MDEAQIVDIWMLFKENIDKKTIDIVAERYIEICADYGASDEAFTNALGNDTELDDAISYYLDIDNDPDEDAVDEWED
jgi:hypothetical protein